MSTLELRAYKAAWARDARKRNPDKFRRNNLAWYYRNRESSLVKMREWYQENKVQRRNYRQQLMVANPSFKVGHRLQIKLHEALTTYTGKRRAPVFESLVGCTVKEFRQHLERQFKPGMSWNNYGLGGWEIDHKQPCCSFDLTDPDQVKLCFHYTNLQPLWRAENASKNRYY
jgi:hypothetical protein